MRKRSRQQQALPLLHACARLRRPRLTCGKKMKWPLRKEIRSEKRRKVKTRMARSLQESLDIFQRTPRGEGKNLKRRPPLHGSQFLTPPHLGMSHTSLFNSLRASPNFPQATPSETAFGGPPKMASKGPSARGFALLRFAPPPPPR